MFTSKLIEPINKELESQLPLVCIDSIYYELATSSGNNEFNISRHVAYKNLCMLVSDNIGNNIITDSSVLSTRHHEGPVNEILLNLLITLKDLDSYKCLYSKYTHKLSEVLYNYVNKNYLTEELLSNYDYMTTEALPKYIDKVEFKEFSQQIIDLSTHIDAKEIEYDAIYNQNNEILTSIKDYCAQDDNISKSIEANFLKIKDNLPIYNYEPYIDAIFAMLKLRGNYISGDPIYTTDMFLKLAGDNMLQPQRTYSVLYYPKNIRKQLNDGSNYIFTHYNFSIPIILQITAISENQFEVNATADNAIDSLKAFNKACVKVDYMGDSFDWINVYALDINNVGMYSYDIINKQANPIQKITPIVMNYYDNKKYALLYDELIGLFAISENTAILLPDIAYVAKSFNDMPLYQPKRIAYMAWQYILSKTIENMLTITLKVLTDDEITILENIFDKKQLLIIINKVNIFNLQTNDILSNPITYLQLIFDICEIKIKLTDILDKVFSECIKTIMDLLSDSFKTTDMHITLNTIRAFEMYFDARGSDDFKKAIDTCDQSDRDEFINAAIKTLYLYRDVIATYKDSITNFGMIYNMTPNILYVISHYLQQYNTVWLFTYDLLQNIDKQSLNNIATASSASKVIKYNDWEIKVEVQQFIDENYHLIITYLKDEFNNETDFYSRAIATYLIDDYIYYTYEAAIDGPFMDPLFWYTAYNNLLKYSDIASALSDSDYQAIIINAQRGLGIVFKNNKILRNISSDKYLCNEIVLVALTWTGGYSHDILSIYRDPDSIIASTHRSVSNNNIIGNELFFFNQTNDKQANSSYVNCIAISGKNLTIEHNDITFDEDYSKMCQAFDANINTNSQIIGSYITAGLSEYNNYIINNCNIIHSVLNNIRNDECAQNIIINSNIIMSQIRFLMLSELDGTNWISCTSIVNSIFKENLGIRIGEYNTIKYGESNADFLLTNTHTIFNYTAAFESLPESQHKMDNYFNVYKFVSGVPMYALGYYGDL